MKVQQKAKRGIPLRKAKGSFQWVEVIGGFAQEEGSQQGTTRREVHLQSPNLLRD